MGFTTILVRWSGGRGLEMPAEDETCGQKLSVEMFMEPYPWYVTEVDQESDRGGEGFTGYVKSKGESEDLIAVIWEYQPSEEELARARRYFPEAQQIIVGEQ